jgi:hypothetical protein
MRYQKLPGPKKHEQRIRSGFLLFPKTIAGELRWWEWAQWMQEYDSGRYDIQCWSAWVDISWVTIFPAELDKTMTDTEWSDPQ